MDYSYKKKIELNEWLITTRWFYMVAVFFIGILGNSLISLFKVKSSFFSIALLILVFLLINAYLYKILRGIKKDQSNSKLKIFSVAQIIIELILFTIITRLVGDGSIASVFFFLPIISGAIIFGVKGAVIIALISVVLVNTAMMAEYLQGFISYFANKGRFSAVELITLKYQTFSFIQTIVTSNFYFVVALVSGYSYRLVFRREQELLKQLDALSQNKKLGDKQAEEFSKTAKQLISQDKDLKNINIELNKKVIDLEKSEKSLIRAFEDLQIARCKTDEERNKTLSIISNFIDPIIVIDKANKINLINPVAKKIFNFLNTDLGQKIEKKNNYSMENFKSIIKKDFQVKNYKVLKAHNPSEEEVVVKHKGQELTYKVITAKVVDSKGNYLGMMKIFYNLTREKMIDKLKSEFISIAAHQLRTPLSAIKWVMKMILDGDVGPLSREQKEFLSKGYQSNERIISLVNDMLNVSRIEEGRFGYNIAKEDFAKIMRIAIDNISNLAKQKSIKLKINIPDKLPRPYVDKKKIDLVLQNLFENAVKYSPEFGTISLSCSADDKELIIKVKDNGVGIPEKDKVKLFTKFFRAENVVRMQTEGSGLGLFIVKNIVEHHGGSLSFVSEEGKGTEFRFTLPLKLK